MTELSAILDTAENAVDDSRERLFELLRIPSISTDPVYAGDCRKAAQFCADMLTELGFDASVRDTTGHPMVVAHGGPADGKPHVLFYGHYDVQPPDPLDLWKTPPFEPRMTKGSAGQDIIVARGAADDKGQLMTFVEACRAWIAANGELPVRVTILFEGEEESGSPSLEAFLEANREELSVDLALVCDTNMYERGMPAITTMLRGMLLDEVIVTAPKMDLHSGYYGGAARNPIRILTRIISDLHDDSGRVTLDGFYDGVPEIEDNVRRQWERLDFDEGAFLAEIGLKIRAGETGRSILEQVWARPTCDVNGIIGGYTGEGTKTVIPSKVSAKVSFRLVGDQDPDKIRVAFRAHVEARLPSDCSVEFIAHGANPAIAFETSGKWMQAARAALADEYDRDAVLMGCGGSIPVVGSFRDMLGMDSLLIGFGLIDDRIHSPNEKYDLDSFRGGIRSWIRILDAFSRA
jgi:acetylornithine deacetylase/succinyl-diaminopimelate desuccinylase-like protein